MSFIWNGVSSDTMKFNVTSRQVYNAPAYDLNAIEVPGRSGDLLNPQNRFKNKQITYTGFMKATDFEGSTWREKLSTGLIQLKGWLCSDAGTYHELTDDYDPGFIRYGYISGETAISDVQDRPFGVTLTVTFSVKPFMYRTGEAMELPETKSASGDIITITDGAENTPLKSCVVNIEPVQSGSGDPSPTNIRPISGWSEVNVWVKPTYDTTLTPTATIPLGQTVYGGTLDFVRGKLTITRKTITFDGSQRIFASSNNRFYSIIGEAIKVDSSNQSTYAGVTSDRMKPLSWAQLIDDSVVGDVACCGPVYGNGIAFRWNQITTATDWKAYFTNNPTQFTYELATPIEVDLTPQTIRTLLGTNNLWADTGEMSIEYPIPTENPYPFGSRPLYEITMAGTGTLVVNGKEWTITDYTGTLYCDTEAMEWYDASQLRNNIVSGDGWPVFEAGENSVSYTGDITKVMVTPRWRTL